MKHILMRLEQLIPTLSGNQLDESFINLIREYDNTWQELPEKQQLVALQDLEDVCQSANDNVRLFCYSLISFRGHDPRWMEEMLKTIERLSELPLDALYFLYWQISIRFTRWPECESETGKILHWRLFQRICASCSAQVNGLEWIDEKERHADTVVVLTAQFLGETVHGPSKTALDRCKTLIQKMGKKILLINTAEISATTNRLSIAGVFPLNYLEYYSSQEYIDWKGTRIPFFQCENDMPNIDTYRMLLQSIVQMKPAYVIEIGTGSLWHTCLVNVYQSCLWLPVFPDCRLQKRIIRCLR